MKKRRNLKPINKSRRKIKIIENKTKIKQNSIIEEDLKRLEKEILYNFNHTESWIIQRRKFFIKLLLIILFVLILLIIATLFN